MVPLSSVAVQPLIPSYVPTAHLEPGPYEAHFSVDGKSQVFSIFVQKVIATKAGPSLLVFDPQSSKMPTAGLNAASYTADEAISLRRSRLGALEMVSCNGIPAGEKGVGQAPGQVWLVHPEMLYHVLSVYPEKSDL